MEHEETCRFRSDFCHDLKLHKEFNRGSIEGNLYFRIMYLTFSGILIWFLYKMAVLGAIETYAETLPGIVAIWLIIEGIRWLSSRGGGIHYKRSVMLNGGKPTNDSVLFCDDCIYTFEQASGNKVKLEYAPIRIVYETKNLLLLGMKYNTFLIVDKQTLTGSREEFGAFLYEKCPKLRNKKVRNCRIGQYINYFKWAVILFSLLLSLFFHPGLQLRQRLMGQIHNGMTTSEITAELESFGISGHPQDQLDSLDETPVFLLSGSKLENVLYRMGLGDRNYETGDFTPAKTGVFFTYYWAQFPETMYADLLTGIDALCTDELSIAQILEDSYQADWDHDSGTITTRFMLNGTPHTIDAIFYEEWYDEQILNELNAMIYDTTGKQLYFCDYEDIGCFIFYGDDGWAEGFSRRTGLVLSPDINEIY